MYEIQSSTTFLNIYNQSLGLYENNNKLFIFSFVLHDITCNLNVYDDFSYENNGSDVFSIICFTN